MSMTQPQLIADRYRLLEPLGQGGMGRVWRALDEVLHREVAIKELVPPPGLTDDERREMRERSLREARAIARLNHINVVRIFDVLRTDGDPWIVMEYVASRSLQDVIANDGPLPVVRVAEIGLGMLAALRTAHRAGVVHRDVKPANVLLAEDGRVVLTDWGLATIPGDPNVTRTGLVLGSPAYIAPERARDGTSGPRTDMWSFGATLYAAVEGQSPFARPSALATLAALATEPPAPARRAGALRPVLSGLLRKEPADRIDPDEADRLLRRASGRKTVARRPLLDGVRRPTALRDRQGFPPLPAAPSSPAAPTPQSPAAPLSPAAHQNATPQNAITAAPQSAPPHPAPRQRTPHNPPGAGVWPISPAGPTAAPTSPAAAPASSAAAAPAVTPTSPAAPTPTSPAAPPTPPADETRPVVVPGGPTARPTSPAARPVSPAARPVSPAARPVSPAARPVSPGGPVARPISPAGRASVPPPPPPPAQGRVHQGNPPRGTDQRTRSLAIVAAALAAVVLMMAAVLLLLRDNSDTKKNPNTARTNPAAQAAPTKGATKPAPTSATTTKPPAQPTTPPSPPAFTLPAGWRMRDNGSGFQVPVPEGWTYSNDGGGRARWTEPNGNRFLLIDQTRNPKPDPKQDWLNNEQARKSGYRNYARVRIETVKYWRAAADWEFTYTSSSGTRLHVLNRGFVTARDQAYSIYLSTPDSQWRASQPMLQVMIEGFKPARR
ncbi:Serine/threonine protein kinase [Asanoa hainanensis]|uniref:non-specific serine/threonine protein kinase n=1 Tax=Asanoa hainanensis TaxID=560556 RepID=A0A239KK67_9ACTN|nr:serine/threonine-protein kinase [Asanoa hainanensis]SNT18380.1 Serine/threonine protein kinase [Asanoa hainanensis]